jgi:hypothetical protein
MAKPKATKQQVAARGRSAKPQKAKTKPAAKQATKAAKPAAKQATKAAKPAAKQATKAAKPAAKQATEAAKPAAKQATRAAKPAKPAAKVVRAAKPAKADGVAGLAGKAMILQIVGDAEAYFIDFARLDPARRKELIAHHLAAYDARKQAEAKPDWHATLVPIALLGESMPPRVREQFDLSAPHEGVLLLHPETGAVLYAASKDDARLAIAAPDLATLAPKASFVSEVSDPASHSYAYAVDRSESEGFTLGQIELMMQLGGAELTLV